MTTVLLFHDARGRTAGFLAFADELREVGHTVHAPDLYDGATFRDLKEGVAYAERIGFPELIRRGEAAADELSADIVYAGFSLGVLPAQSLAQTRPSAKGALLYHPGTEEDRVAARAMEREIEDAELFLYPGSGHLFADATSDDYDERAAMLLKERTLAFLRRID